MDSVAEAIDLQQMGLQARAAAAELARKSTAEKMR